MKKLLCTCKRPGFPAMIILGLLFAAVRSSAAADDANADLHRQIRERNAQLLEERTRVLRTDPEAVRIRRRIETLYRELDRIVSNDPTVKKILREREALRRRIALETGAAPAIKKTTAGKRTGKE